MFLAARDFLERYKNKKEKNKELKENIKNIEENLENDNKDTPSINKINKKNKPIKRNFKKPKESKTFLKDVGKSKKKSLLTPKKTKKEKRKKEKKRREKHYTIMSLFFIELFLLYFVCNLIFFIFSKGTPVDGYFVYDNGNIYFELEKSKINILENSSLSNLDVGDKIYLNKDLEVTKFPNPFGFCLKGKVTKKDDYYIYIDYNYSKKIETSASVILSNYNLSNGNCRVYLKKFLFSYRINEELLKQVKNMGDEAISDIKKTIFSK